MMHFSVLTVKRLMLAAAVGTAVLAAAPAPSNAAELGPVVAPGARQVERVRPIGRYANWRDRCAYAGYYCLYAWNGYVYHYPWDDRPAAYGFYSRRLRYR